MSGQSVLVISKDETLTSRIKKNIPADGMVSIKVFDPSELPPPESTFCAALLDAAVLAAAPEALEQVLDLYPGCPLVLIGGESRRNGVFAHLPVSFSDQSFTETVRAARRHHDRLVNWAQTQPDPEASRVVFATQMDGLMVTDEAGRLQVANAAALEALQILPGAWPGRPLEGVVRIPALLDAVRLAKQNGPLQVLVEPEAGRFYLAHTFPLPAGGCAVLLHNYTYFRELESLKTELVQTISHDLRSPLTAVLGYVELIAKIGPVNAGQQQFIRKAQDGVDSITRLIDALLALSRIEAAHESPAEKIQLEKVTLEAAGAMQAQFDRKGQQLDVRFSAGLPPVRGNATWLRRMILNLLENAHTYSPESTTISIAAHVEDRQIILQVSDQGIGIPADELPYIFDRQFRGSNIPPDVPGSGLGLAFVKTIVQNHGGRLWCDLNPGQGTTFTVVLPAIPGPPTDD